jgi:NADP-reducing hydrogenase subunit HndB
MMVIKSIEELKTLRDANKADLFGRSGEDSGNKIRITVGMATCGIASGARDTINAIIEEVKEQELNNVTVVQSGCMGFCYAEPTIEVREPGKEPVLYGSVDKDRAKEIVKQHIAGGKPILDWEIKKSFNTTL